MNRTKLKTALTGGIAAAAITGSVVLATPANASDSSYLNCLTGHGQIIWDADAAINLGYRIKSDEANNVPREQIIWNLVNIWGTTVHDANTDIDCAYNRLGA